MTYATITADNGIQRWFRGSRVLILEAAQDLRERGHTNVKIHWR